MSDLRVTNLRGRDSGTSPTCPDGMVVTGVCTATSFDGDLTGDVTGTVSGTAGGLSGTPDITVRNVTGVAATFTGVLTYEDVTNVDSVGVVTARSGVNVGPTSGIGITFRIDGTSEFSGIATFHKGADFNDLLKEQTNIVANKLSAEPSINIDNGMVHYYTTNETATPNPNFFSTVGINSVLSTGEAITVTLLSKPNGAGYFPRVAIDGKLAGITTYWSGGSAPSSAQSSGVDFNSYLIVKTGNEAYDVFANTSNFA
jgi:hypothetical protein